MFVQKKNVWPGLVQVLPKGQVPARERNPRIMNLEDAVNVRHPPLDLSKTLVHVTRKPVMLGLDGEAVGLPETGLDQLLPDCVLAHD